jgi:hypothetical protein
MLPKTCRHRFWGTKGLDVRQLDGRVWNANGLQSKMPGSNVFSGSGMSGDRSMTVRGAFVHNGIPASANLPAAIGGQFAVQGPAYGANGIMVGSRR